MLIAAGSRIAWWLQWEVMLPPLARLQAEARNDMRPQYTLRGPGWEDLWSAAAIAAGDVLTFTREPGSGRIMLGERWTCSRRHFSPDASNVLPAA